MEGLSVDLTTPALGGALPSTLSVSLSRKPGRGGADSRPSTPAPRIETHDAGNRELPDDDLGKLVRRNGQAPTGDRAVDAAHDNARIVYDFFHKVLGRDSLDGAGMVLKSTVHYGERYNNAYWDGTHMTYGDGDGKDFGNFAEALDVVGHEMAHAVTERTANLDYHAQSGALNESWSDVFGELIQQWHENPRGWSTPEAMAKADWLIGESIYTPGKPGDGLRSLKAPGTAYPDDPQPADMAHYKRMSSWDDNGGVHINSGIPNRAAYLAASRIGGEKLAKIWYRALTDYLRPTSQFSDAASATMSAARDLFRDGPESQAVADAWKAVGVKGTLIDASRSRPGRGSTPRPRTANPGIVPPWLSIPATAGNGGALARVGTPLTKLGEIAGVPRPLPSTR